MGIITRIFLGKDQDHFNNLDDNQKLAFCKLVSEVVKADDTVLREEFDELPEIPKSFMANSKTLKLEDAINQFKSVDQKVKDFIIGELDQVMKSDHFSSKDEIDKIYFIKKKLL